jgi:diketogulonate reductase-like aldo/keto reductase
MHLALRWSLEQPGVTAALWGARHPAQLDPIEEVMGWALSFDAMREIDRIVRARERSGGSGIHGAARTPSARGGLADDRCASRSAVTRRGPAREQN